MDRNFFKLWNKIKSKSFKIMILNTYDFEKLTTQNLIKLIELYRNTFNLKIKVS